MSDNNNRGYVYTEARKNHIENLHKLPRTKEWREKMSDAHKGSRPSKETRRKMRISRKKRTDLNGKKSHFWKGGITTYERKLFLNARRRARKLNAEGSHTQGEWELLKRQYGYTCPACGRQEPEITLTEDLIISLSKGGSDYIENIQPLCRSCNCRKHTKIIKYEQKRGE